MRIRPGAVTGLLVAGMLGGGCVVQVDSVRNPDLAFRQAMRDVERVAGRRGRASRVNVLVWQSDEHQLIRAQVPLWLVRKVADRVERQEAGHRRAEEMGRDASPDAIQQDVARRIGRHVRIRDLERAGRGAFVEVEDDEDGERVLVWLS